MTNKEMYEKLRAACNQLAAALQNDAPNETLRRNLDEGSRNLMNTMVEIDFELTHRIEGK
jgi:hypothetical protein